MPGPGDSIIDTDIGKSLDITKLDSKAQDHLMLKKMYMIFGVRISIWMLSSKDFLNNILEKMI